VDVKEELDRVPCWIRSTIYTNCIWSVHLPPMITRPLTNNYLVLCNSFPCYLYLSVVFAYVVQQISECMWNSFFFWKLFHNKRELCSQLETAGRELGQYQCSCFETWPHFLVLLYTFFLLSAPCYRCIVIYLHRKMTVKLLKPCLE